MIALIFFLIFFSAAAVAAPAPPPSAGALPNAAGKTTVVRVCAVCHGLATFSADRMSRAEWQRIVDQMISRGAKATPSERRVIIDYLAKHLGASARPKSGSGTANRN